MSKACQISFTQINKTAQVDMFFWEPPNGSSDMRFHFSSAFSVKFASIVRRQAWPEHQSLLLLLLHMNVQPCDSHC